MMDCVGVRVSDLQTGVGYICYRYPSRVCVCVKERMREGESESECEGNKIKSKS